MVWLEQKIDEMETISEGRAVGVTSGTWARPLIHATTHIFVHSFRSERIRTPSFA